MTAPFRIWDSESLQQSLQTALQIRTKIEEVCIQAGVSPYALPESLVPSVDLYNLVAGYEAMYSKLLDYDLVKTGNLKSNRNNIH